MGEEGITVADVFDKISKRLVPFEMVDKVFKDLTSEGGKFYQMQEIQSETLKGKISNLKDAYMIMFNEIGSRQEGLLKGGVDALRSLAENYEKVGRTIVGFVAAYGTYKATLITINAIEAVHQATMLKGNFAIVRREALLASLTKQSKLFAAVQKLIAGINPWVAIGAAVAGLGAYFISATAQSSRFRKEIEGIANIKFNEAEKSAETFKKLAERLKDSTEGSQEYRDAIADLNRQYGDYLPNLLNEKNALTEILKVENQVTNAIYARAKAYASEEGLRKIEERYGGDVQRFGEEVIKIISAEGYGEDAARDFLKGFRTALQDNPDKAGLVIFSQVLDEYFGEGSWGKMAGTNYWQYQREGIDDYAKAVQRLEEENQKLFDQMDTRFGVQGYSTNLERQVTEPIVAAYNKAMQEIRNQRLPAEEFAEKATTLELARLYQLKQAFTELNAGGEWTAKIREIQNQIDALKPKDMSWLQKYVNPLVTGKGNNDLKVKIDTDYEEYLDNLGKEYKAVTEAYANFSKTYNKLNADKQRGVAVDTDMLHKVAEQNELYKSRKKVIEDIGSALGISLNGSSDSGNRKSPEQEKLETRIDLLKKLQSAYEKLSEYVSEDKMSEMLSNFFASSEVEGKDDIIRSLDYRKQLIAAALELEKYDKEAAERLRSYIGYDEVSEQIDAYKELVKIQKAAQDASEDYREFMENWLSGTELEGEGAEFKLSKIVSDYQKALDRIAKKTADARKKLRVKADAEEKAGTWSALGFARDMADINEKANIESDNALASYAEKGREAIKKMYEEWREGAMDFNNLSDKTLGQLKNMAQLIESFSTANVEVFPPEILANLETLGIDIEKVREVIAKLKKEDADKIGIEIDKETLDMWQEIVSNISAAANAVRDYAEAIGDDNLLSAMDGFVGMAEISSGVLSRLAQGDGLGAIISGISTLFQKVMDAATSSARLSNAIAEAADEAERLNAASRLALGVDTIWGEDTIVQIRNATNELKRYQQVADENRRSADKTITWKSGFLNWGRSSAQLSDMIAQLGYDLYDAYGNLNADALQAILTTYESLTSADREWIEDAIKNTELYADAMEQLNGAMKDTWGNLADNLADDLIEARKEVGDAYHALADDIRATFGDMADDIAKKLVSSFIQKNILDKYTDELGNIYDKIGGGANETEIANALSTLAESVIKDASLGAEYINRFYDAVEAAGMTFERNSDTLANGIKGITENQADLLASYVNGMRADVAYGKTQRDSILAEIKNVASYVASPTLMDYLNRIQANTFDTAQSNQKILSHIESMMTSEGGLTALRVYQ